jgi:hypothetical protein
VSDSAVVKNHGAFIWSVADLLRGDYKPHEYGRVILPFTVLRRLDCVLEATKAEDHPRGPEQGPHHQAVAGQAPRVGTPPTLKPGERSDASAGTNPRRTRQP